MDLLLQTAYQLKFLDIKSGNFKVESHFWQLCIFCLYVADNLANQSLFSARLKLCVNN